MSERKQYFAEMVEPSDAERAELPAASAAYIEALERENNALSEKIKPRVRQLVWDEGFIGEGPDERWLAECEAPNGIFYCIEVEGTAFKVTCSGWDVDISVETPDEAKAAAQADFERRVMECLE